MQSRLFSFLFLLAASVAAAPAGAQAETRTVGWNTVTAGEQRTEGRDVTGGAMQYPDWMMQRPGYYEFTPMVSNHDALNDHDAQFTGQDWDTSQWPANWSAAKAMKRFYASGIFTKQTLDGRKSRVARSVYLGPTFYQLSTLDQNRTLKLLTDEAHVFEKNADPVLLRDHATGKLVGSYSQTGLQMN